MPVGITEPSEADTSSSRASGASCGSSLAPSGRGAAADSSTIVFQAPHVEHCPDHFACTAPHSLQVITVFVFM